jgi:hypothetical protein
MKALQMISTPSENGEDLNARWKQLVDIFGTATLNT